jgi:putative restriction endonuclease
MRLYVYPTDSDWFNYLRGRPDLDEVNFWRPGGQLNFRPLSPGDLFLFRLKSPINKIAGGGIFVHSSLFPISASWVAFGEKNGAPSERLFLERIARYREQPPERLDLASNIGCIILQNPFFLPRELWIDVPGSLNLNRQQGEALDATVGEGKRLFDLAMTVMERAPRGVPGSSAVYEPMFGDPILTRHRLGQGAFRVLVSDNYMRRCAVTGEKTFPVLEAAHILSIGRGGRHRPDNGLLLRSDIHRLFDLGYVSVTPDYRFAVSPSLRADYSNGKVYYDLVGRTISLPSRLEDRPGREYLEHHRDLIYRA